MIRRRHRKPQEAPELRSDINITPLVDVVLVLLIIFMVVTPQLEEGAPVELPRVNRTSDPGDPSEEPLVVSIDRTGQTWWQRSAIDRDEAIRQLEAAHRAEPARPFLIRADQNVPFVHVREVLEGLRDSGLPGAKLAVEDEES